ncbi:MAG: serine hydrolase [Burkholderiaceae bacterium]
MNKPTSTAWQPVVDYAHAHQSQWSRDPQADAASFGIHQADDPPHNRLLGPVFARGPASGVIIVDGQERCAWGEPDRPDMTFSVTKTYLALTAGLAFDSGLLPDLHEPIARRLPGLGFDDPHNSQVTWEQMLQFTSEWQGSCFGVPDTVDHHRRAGFQPPADDGPRKGSPRALQAPGTFWEYNDVRINQFSLALLHLFGRPLPEVFGEAIMQPLGASDTWHWHGYDNSWVDIGGRPMQSVPGGGHWGGGMRIAARDQALVARMMLEGGRAGGRQLVSQEWLRRMVTPCAIAPFYGYFTWLNQGHRPVPSAAPDDYFAVGVGAQVIWHSPQRNMVAVLRWFDFAALEGMAARIDSALAG